MRAVISIASLTRERASTFLNAFPMPSLEPSDTLVVVLTGKTQSILVRETREFVEKSGSCVKVSIKKAAPRKRKYSSVVYEKVQAAAQFCDNETVFMNIDDDYAFNPHAIPFALRIFEQHPEVNYLSLLRGPGIDESQHKIVKMEGIRFVRWQSCMGGSLMTRWSHFGPLVQEYFGKARVNGEDAGRGGNFDGHKNGTFGIDWWPWLEERTHVRKPVYTILDFSLVQHCNLISSYLKGKSSVLEHMWGDRFDARCDPFELGRIIQQKDK